MKRKLLEIRKIKKKRRKEEKKKQKKEVRGRKIEEKEMGLE